MNIPKVITFLVAGIVIGAILFFAGFGVLNLFKSSPDSVEVVTENVMPIETVPQAETVPVNPPTIEVTSIQSDASNEAVPAMQGDGTSNSPFKIKPLNSKADDASNTPGQEIKTIAFGTLTLSTVNSVNNEPINADFLIENSDSVAIALVKDTSTSTLSLPVGDYKITVSQGSEKVVRFLGVKDGLNGSEIFELDVPVLTGEAADPVIVGENTDTTVSSNSTDSAPANQSASASVTQNDSSAPTATQQAEATDSTSAIPTPTTAEVDTSDNKSAEASANQSAANSAAVGGLRLSALTKQGKRPITASFYVQRLNGQNVETIRNVKTQQLTLPAGKYKVTARTSEATVVKEVEVLATKGVHEIFLIADQATTEQQSSTTQTTASAPNSSSNTDNGAAATTRSSTASTTESEAKKTPGRLELFAQKASNNSPVKSNFYVQMPNGKMVASKVYVDSIGYKLPAGKYKVIVRATSYKDKSVMLNVRSGQVRREVFKLDASNSAGSNSSRSNVRPPADAAPARTAQQAAPTPQRPTQNTPQPFGGLTVNIVAESDGSPLSADIVITQRDGTPLKQANGVASASFDLPPREFLIRVTYGGLTTNHQVNVVAGKLAIKTISFDTARMTRQERRRLRRERRERSQ